MLRDIRDTDLFKEATRLYQQLRRPGTGQISTAAEPSVSPDGKFATFAGTLMDKLEGAPQTRVCQADLESGDTHVLTFGPNTDRLPKYSPDGRLIAFLSDRHRAGDFQLYILDRATGAAQRGPSVDGWVEYLHWSPNGRQILLGAAGHGADISGGQGAVTSKQIVPDLPSWLPAVETGDETYRWRRAWIYDLASGGARQASSAHSNIWEAAWCGNDAIVAVVSPEPGEGLWYTAALRVIDIADGSERTLHTPEAQLGWPSASPSGKHVAFVEAICSDRWVVAGQLCVTDLQSESTQRVDTHRVDVTYTEWRSERRLLVAGHRGFETVVGLYDIVARVFEEVWASCEIAADIRYATVSGFGERGDCVLVGESFLRAPEIAIIQKGEYRAVKSFSPGPIEHVSAIGAVERVEWSSRDGLVIQGWLLLPKNGNAPYPLVMDVHGGPVWHWRPRWLGRNGVHLLMLIRRGYAVFFPNPRGSSGRGQEFIRHVVGDMGGADTYDYLSGLDHLVDRRLADPKRIGVTGGSYGGFMTSWLITQDSRFAAAVPVAPVTNHVSEHLISNIPHFVRLFLADTYNNAGGKYFQRSPIMHAHKVQTPTLNICGILDRCTPPEEAVQFHNALLENGAKSVLVVYPEEGHGVRKLPAALDYAARVVSWFQDHMPPTRMP